MAIPSVAMLAIGIASLFIILLIMNIYIVAYFTKQGDKRDNWWTKCLIICSLQLASFTVLMVSVDASNNGGNPQCDKGYPLQDSQFYCGGMNFWVAWQALFLIILFVLVLFIPFASFYWEAEEDEENKSPFMWALCQEIVIIICVCAVGFPLYYYSRDNLTHIPVQGYVGSLLDMNVETYTLAPGVSVLDYVSQAQTPQVPYVATKLQSTVNMTYPVTLDLYIIALISWFGWFLFAMFTGAGLAGIPCDLIGRYIYRPKPIDDNELTVRRADLQVRIQDILHMSLELKKTRAITSGVTRTVNAMADRVQINKLYNMMYEVQDELAHLESCKNSKKKFNPLVPFFQLFLGLVSLVLSVTWVLQMIVYRLAFDAPFLNTYLHGFDNWFPMFGFLTYAIYCIYLLLCLVNGCFRVGLRLLCCCQIQSMVVGKTEITSFMFNVSIILLCTAPLVHFVTSAFSGYTAYSDAYLVFEVQIKNMAFFAPMFQKYIFTYIILAMAALTTLYLLYRSVKPRHVEQYSLGSSGSRGVEMTSRNAV